MSLPLIDSHCHFDADRFDPDRDAAYMRARAAGVAAQIVPAVSAALWSKVKAVTTAYPGLYPAYGLHPMCLDEHRPEHLIALAKWVEQARPAAIGECGLDYYIPGLDPAQQVVFFTEQLRIARAYDLPVIVHARRAVDHVIKYLRRFPGVHGVVHSFSGSEQQARRLLESGFPARLWRPAQLSSRPAVAASAPGPAAAGGVAGDRCALSAWTAASRPT